MADEPRPDRQLARHRGALLAGQEPRRRWPPADPRPQVGPRTSRPARGLHGRQHLEEGRSGRPRAGFRDFSLRSPERQMGRSAR
jgi:hypothetical protein